MTTSRTALLIMIPAVLLSVSAVMMIVFMIGDKSNGQNSADIGLHLVAEGLNSPVHMESPPDDTRRRFIVDRIGIVHVLTEDGQLLSEPFLDVRNRMVSLRTGYDERGLLGLAFHPDFADNGRVFVHYSAPLRSGAPKGWDHTGIVSEFRVSADNPNRVDQDSERVILEIDQPQSNHNGGTIAFGPDGFLYIGLGDGGSGNDAGFGHPPMGNGQDITTLLGSILRIDADGGVPEDNPFVGRAGRDEIYAWGFRNPYRFSFDRGGDRHLFVADVGQNMWEEVNVVTGPGNFGWRIKEGSHWFNPDNSLEVITQGPSVGPQGEPLIDPIIEYRHPNIIDGETVSERVSSENAVEGISIIGGYVYRGTALPGWQGAYIFGDWSTSFQRGRGKVLAARPSAAYARTDTGANTWAAAGIGIEADAGRGSRTSEAWTVEEVLRLNEFVIGFGEDYDGELYVLTTQRPGPVGATGKVYKLVFKDR